MLFTIYFANFTTGVIAATHRRAMNATAAVDNFRRKMRAAGELSSGDNYNIILYIGERDLSAVPDSNEFRKRSKIAR